MQLCLNFRGWGFAVLSHRKQNRISDWSYCLHFAPAVSSVMKFSVCNLTCYGSCRYQASFQTAHLSCCEDLLAGAEQETDCPFQPCSPANPTNRVREIINKSTSSTIFSATFRKMKVIIPRALPAAPPHRSSRSRSAPSSHVWSHTHSQGHQTHPCHLNRVSDSRLTVWADQCRLLHLYCTGESWPSDSHESPRSEPHREHRMISFRNKHKVLI